MGKQRSTSTRPRTTPTTSWAHIEADWGEGWDEFDDELFTPAPAPARATPRPTPTRARRGPVPTKPSMPETPTPTRRSSSTRRSRAAVGGQRPELRAVPDNGGGRGRTGRRSRLDAPGRPPTRFRTVVAVLLILLLLIVGKLVDVQILQPERFVAAGEAQRFRSITLDADRGRILDRDGNDLALSVLQPTIFADPSMIEEPEQAALALGPILGIPVTEVAQKLLREGRFVYLARRVDDDTASRVLALDIDGIGIVEESERFTPSDRLARSIIGRVAPDQVGSTGVEFIYDDLLTGTAGEVRYERAPGGGTIAVGAQSRIPATAGDDVVLTIDRGLQHEAERVLAAQVEALGAKGGVVIVTRPESGEVLAMANVIDTEEAGVVPSSANLAVTSVFEPGSVNKVITIAAALEEGLVEPETELTVPWRLQVSDHEFTDDHFHPTEPMSVTDILSKSSNIGTIMLGQELGKDRIDSYLRDFGFGDFTALEFPNESAGLLLPTERWSGTSIGSIPIGQGIAVTALQMLQAYNVIANDGVYVAPRLVKETVAADGTVTAVPPAETHRVVSAQTATQVRAMLAEVVENGTGTRAQVDGYRVGGKTGTARKPQSTGTYRDQAGNYHYVAAFTGLVPAEHPELSIIVVIDEPSATIYGGTAAAPVFADLATFALHRFRIPPMRAGE